MSEMLSLDQQSLRELEARCIQEEPPPCMATCPLHVDARAFVGHLAAGNGEEALAVLTKSMPLPTILGRICDAPCRQACNRRHAGGAIQIADLERAIVSDSEPAERRVMPLPKKGVDVAVAGSGLSSLTVAWDLIRKGYDVTLLESQDAAGSGLLKRFPRRLDHQIVAAEIALLARLGVRFRRIGAVDLSLRQTLLEEYGALYVGLDAVSGDAWKVVPSPEAAVIAGLTDVEGLFAAGDHPSPVWQAAGGRWCATTMDRWLQNVSLTAGREREEPFETGLITRLEEQAPLPPTPMADEGRGYETKEAIQEATRCLQCQCLECVKACAYLEQFGGYPKTYAREIYNNEAIVMGERKANRLINSCSLCGLCETICPNDFAMADLCLAARQSMVARDKMPPGAHQFALEDMAFSTSERCALVRHAPGTSASRHLFFPGCQLCASTPGQVDQVYAFLRGELSGGVALMLNCCGAPAHWSGRKERFENNLASWKKQWERLGRPRPIMACSTCLQVFTEHLPQVKPVSLWEVLAGTDIAESPIQLPDGPLAIHDPCTSRHEPAVQAAARDLLCRAGAEVEELPLWGEKTECCGFGGLMQNANMELATEVARRRVGYSPNDYIAYCAMCRDNLAAAGKRCWHLLDLFFPDPAEPDAADRPRPGWSQRRENRARLKTELLERWWGETGGQAPETIKLQIRQEVESLLEARRILHEDIRRVIVHAEKSGPRFRHPTSGHLLAVHRPHHATFWVAYTLADEGYVVHNAYAHRMEVRVP